MTVTTKTEFDNISAVLCGRMVSSDRAIRRQAAAEAETLLSDLPLVLRNSPHCRDEIDALNNLVARVRAEKSNHPHRNTERVTVENLRGDAERVTLPQPHWTGREERATGIILQALYRGPRTGRMFARSFSQWQVAPGQGSRGTMYEELSESDYLRLCDLAGCEPVADAPAV